jgi:hypothetical protein
MTPNVPFCCLCTARCLLETKYIRLDELQLTASYFARYHEQEPYRNFLPNFLQSW